MLVSPTILSTITHTGKCSPPQISHIRLLKKPSTTVTRPLASFTSMRYTLDGGCSYQSSHWNVAGDTVVSGYRIFKRGDNVQGGWTVSPEGTSVLMECTVLCLGLCCPFLPSCICSELHDWQQHICCHWALVRNQVVITLLTMPNCFKPLDRSSLPWCKVSWNYELNKPFLPWVAFVFYHSYKKKTSQAN